MVPSNKLQAYERVLEWPVAMVIAVLWLVGLMLEVWCVLALYLVVTALLYALAG
jgi:hypothetical protein